MLAMLDREMEMAGNLIYLALLGAGCFFVMLVLGGATFLIWYSRREDRRKDFDDLD